MTHLDNTLSTKTKDDYQPHIDVTNKGRWSYWDGITHYGTCNVGTTRARFVWVEEELTSLDPWERIEFTSTYQGVTEDFVSVSRKRHGFMVQHVFALTPDEIAILDRYADIARSIPDVPRDDKGTVLSMDDYNARHQRINDLRQEAGCSYAVIRKFMSATKDRTHFIGYTFVDQIEFNEDYYWFDNKEKLSQQPQETQDFVNSVPLCED